MASPALAKVQNEVASILQAIHLGHLLAGGPEHGKKVHRIAALAAKHPDLMVVGPAGMALPMSMIAPGVLQHYLQVQHKKKQEPPKVLEIEYKPHVSHPLPASSPFSFESEVKRAVRKQVKRRVKQARAESARASKRLEAERKKKERQEMVQVKRAAPRSFAAPKAAPAPSIVHHASVPASMPVVLRPAAAAAASQRPTALSFGAPKAKLSFLSFGFGRDVALSKKHPDGEAKVAVKVNLPAVTASAAPASKGGKKRVRVETPAVDMSFMAVFKRCVAELKRESRKKARKEKKQAKSTKVVSKGKKKAKAAASKKKPKAMSVAKKIVKKKKKAAGKKKQVKKAAKPKKMKTRSCKK